MSVLLAGLHNRFTGIWFPHFNPPVNNKIAQYGPVAMPSNEYT